MSPSVILAGAGYWGKNLARNFYGLGALAAIVDSNEPVLEERRTQYPGIKTYKDYDAALREVDASAVVLATPAAQHFTMARKAIDSGRDIFVEKPLALTVEDGTGLVELARKNKRVLFVGHILHYHAGVTAIKKMINEGAIGRLQYIYSNRLNLGKIRREENILWSFAPHDISVILSLAGEEPDFVRAVGNNFLHAQISDTTMTNLNFPSGVGAHIFVSWLHPFKEQRLVVIGSEGMLVFEDTQPVENKVVLYPHRIDWRRGMPVPLKKEGQSIPLEQNWEEPLRAECEAFLHSVVTREQPITDGEEGLRVLRVLEACQRGLGQWAGAVPSQAGPSASKSGQTEDIECFVHETAIIDDGVEIGDGSKIWHFSHVLKESKIGAHCNVGQNVMIGPRVTVGRRCKIQNNVSLFEGVTLEDEVFCGPSMVFTNVMNPRAAIPRMKELKATLIKKGATIGANATIVCGHTIGSYAFIGAGAVVIQDVPDYGLMVGNPARQIGWMCSCGERLYVDGRQADCAACGIKYEMVEGRLKLSGKPA